MDLNYIDEDYPTDYNDDYVEEPSGTNGVCYFLETNLYLYSYWWVLIIIQLLAPLIVVIPLYSVDVLFHYLGVRNCIERCGMSVSNMTTFMIQLSFWLWLIYLILSTTCQSRDNPDTEPLFITAIVFAVLLYLINLSSLCGLEEDQAIMKKTTVDDFQTYLDRARNMAPRDMIEGTAYHYETVPKYGSDNRRGTRSEKVESYNGSEIFHYDKWIDISDWAMTDIGTSNHYLTIVSFVFDTQPGDSYTKHELDTFKTNYKSYVKDLDASTDKFKYKIQVYEGHNHDSFREVFVKKPGIGFFDIEDDEEDEDESLKDSEPHNLFSIVNPEVSQPWYTSRTVLIVTTLLVISIIPKIAISAFSRKFKFVIKKRFFCDPDNQFTDYMFITRPTLPYTGAGRGEMPLISAMNGTRTYDRSQVTVEHKTAFLSSKNKPIEEEHGSLVSYYRDISSMEYVQNY